MKISTLLLGCHLTPQAYFSVPHIIRRTSTIFHKACIDFHAYSRWCLTGTPIQNRLEDIGALFIFLKADPFHTMAQFRHFIVTPYNDESEQMAVDRLILLYESFCLRRTKDILELPGMDVRLRELTFTPAEQDQYEKTMNILNRQIREQANNHTVSTKFGLFQAHLQLRIFCNHGTYQKMFSWHRRNMNLHEEQEALDLEFGFDGELKCSACYMPRPVLGTNLRSNKFNTNCAHKFCEDCYEAYTNVGGEGSSQSGCPLCAKLAKSFAKAGNTSHGQRTMQHNQSTWIDADGDVPMIGQATVALTHDESYFLETGFSTKMQALVEDVLQDLEYTKRHVFLLISPFPKCSVSFTVEPLALEEIYLSDLYPPC